MNTTSLRARKGVTTASLVLCGLLAGGTLATVGTASAAGSGSTGSTTTQSAAPRSADAAVTGTEADKVKAAVKAKFSTATITTVRKDPDGSYDALGTDTSGARVFYDVSADLKTITAGGGKGGPGHAPAAAGSSSATTTG